LALVPRKGHPGKVKEEREKRVNICRRSSTKEKDLLLSTDRAGKGDFKREGKGPWHSGRRMACKKGK